MQQSIPLSPSFSDPVSCQKRVCRTWQNEYAELGKNLSGPLRGCANIITSLRCCTYLHIFRQTQESNGTFRHKNIPAQFEFLQITMIPAFKKLSKFCRKKGEGAWRTEVNENYLSSPLIRTCMHGVQFSLREGDRAGKEEEEKVCVFLSLSLFSSASAAAVSGSGRRIMRLRRTGVPA